MRFKDKVVIVTGAAGGIGGAISARFAAEGAKVIVTDTNGCPASIIRTPAPRPTRRHIRSFARSRPVTAAARNGRFSIASVTITAPPSEHSPPQGSRNEPINMVLIPTVSSWFPTAWNTGSSGM